MPPVVFKRPPRNNYYTCIRGRVVSTGVSCQRTALKIAAEMEAVGIEAYRKGKRTLGEYLPDLIERHLHYLKDVDKRDKTHIRKKRQMLMFPIEQGAFKQLKYVTKQSFEPWWNDLSCGPKTRNEYLTAWNVFLDWLVYEGKLSQNPLKGRIKRARVPRRTENVRRALTLYESKHLLEVAGKYELLYLMAITTGARNKELRLLNWDDVHETAENPFVVLQPETTKNDKGREQYLPPETVALIKKVRSAAQAGRVFPVMPSHHTFDKHLRLAGIEKKTSDGIACFHSLRHTFTTTVARTTQDPRIAQRLADHADITTTQRYMHTESNERAAVMAQFPSFRADERATKRAVGMVQSGLNEGDVGHIVSSVEHSQMSGIEPFRLAERSYVQHGLEMEPGGIEPPCRDSQQDASTSVVIRFISA